MTTLVLVFKKIESKDETKYNNFYSSSKVEIIINESNITDVFQSVYTTIITNIQKSLGKVSGCIIDSVVDHTITILKYNPLAGSNYITLPKELDHPRKGLINIKNIDDNECFKWSMISYLNPADHLPATITKANQDFAKKLDFKDTKFPSKIRDIHKIEEKNSINITVFGYENKENYSIYASKNVLKKTCSFTINRRRKKRLYVLIKGFNTSMYDHTLHPGRKHFCRYCLQEFSTEEMLKSLIVDCFKINDKQRIIMPKKGELVKFKNYERKIKSPFIIYGDFESALVPEKMRS